MRARVGAWRPVTPSIVIDDDHDDDDHDDNDDYGHTIHCQFTIIMIMMVTQKIPT